MKRQVIVFDKAKSAHRPVHPNSEHITEVGQAMWRLYKQAEKALRHARGKAGLRRPAVVTRINAHRQPDA